MIMSTLSILFSIIFVPLTMGYGKLDHFGDGLIQELFNRYDPNINEYITEPDYEEQVNAGLPKGQRSLDKMARSVLQTRVDDILLGREPSIRDREYMEHSSLFGHKYMQGGAGEGKQLLKPDGSVQNFAVIKSDTILPAYCDPPNPCPIGYTAEDGCLEDFVNSADFSRDYQSSQKCMCDREHMFDCPGNNDDNQLDTLARSIQNNALSERDIDRIVGNIQEDHKVVAKKFHQSKVMPTYLNGEKLPVVAKKAPHLAKN
ncbi:secretogranin_V domain-containing protein 7B2 isoform X1 [Brevipalpus obovatus]|uniref:secretogranin_V domain-containing protein 7B2 isoform X1 n=1 Tax=Brevipalpus obovatus TaxID=246614 RepID=UPI003D9EDB6B